MPQLLSDPSFELGLVWEYSAQGATRVQAGASAYDGIWVAQLESREGITPFSSSLGQGLTFAVAPGQPYRLRYRREAALSGHRLRILIDRGAGSGLALVEELTATGGPVGEWIAWESFVDLVADAPGRVELRTTRQPGAALGTARWWVDLVTLGEDEEDADVVRRREIKAAVAAKLTNYGSWSTTPKVHNADRAIHELTNYPAICVLYLEERKQVEQLTRRRGVLDLALAIYARGEDAADVCDELAGEAEEALETSASPTKSHGIELAYVRDVETIRVRPIEETQGTSGDVRLWIVVVRIQYTHDKGAP